jgi:hypothetical protein
MSDAVSDEELLATIAAETTKLRELRAEIARERAAVEAAKEAVEEMVRRIRECAEMMHLLAFPVPPGEIN